MFQLHCMLFSPALAQAEILQLLASEHDEWAEIYPNLSLLASAGLVIPVSTVNCERDFSTMNRVSECYLYFGTKYIFHLISLWSI